MVCEGKSVMRWRKGNIHVLGNIRENLEMRWDSKNEKSWRSGGWCKTWKHERNWGKKEFFMSVSLGHELHLL